MTSRRIQPHYSAGRRRCVSACYTMKREKKREVIRKAVDGGKEEKDDEEEEDGED